MAAITVTERAAARVGELLMQCERPHLGVRLSIKSKGCSGFSYVVDYADKKESHDEVVEAYGATVIVDASSVMFVLGCEMDYVDDKLQSGFVFRNPNERGRCGCGESFTV